MSAKTSLSIAAVTSKIGEYGRRIRPYGLVIFLVFAAALYGFVLFQINTLSSMEPTEEAIQKQVKTAKLSTIDPKVVDQLHALQDNSVAVQTLFEDARNNPF